MDFAKDTGDYCNSSRCAKKGSQSIYSNKMYENELVVDTLEFLKIL